MKIVLRYYAEYTSKTLISFEPMNFNTRDKNSAYLVKHILHLLLALMVNAYTIFSSLEKT
jgi:hypothetical protein